MPGPMRLRAPTTTNGPMTRRPDSASGAIIALGWMPRPRNGPGSNSAVSRRVPCAVFHGQDRRKPRSGDRFWRLGRHRARLRPGQRGGRIPAHCERKIGLAARFIGVHQTVDLDGAVAIERASSSCAISLINIRNDLARMALRAGPNSPARISPCPKQLARSIVRRFSYARFGRRCGPGGIVESAVEPDTPRGTAARAERTA